MHGDDLVPAQNSEGVVDDGAKFRVDVLWEVLSVSRSVPGPVDEIADHLLFVIRQGFCWGRLCGGGGCGDRGWLCGRFRGQSGFGRLCWVCVTVYILRPVAVEVFRVEVESSRTGEVSSGVALTPVVFATVSRVGLETVFLACVGRHAAQQREYHNQLHFYVNVGDLDMSSVLIVPRPN